MRQNRDTVEARWLERRIYAEYLLLSLTDLFEQLSPCLCREGTIVLV